MAKFMLQLITLNYREMIPSTDLSNKQLMYLSMKQHFRFEIIQYINNQWFTGQTDRIQKLKRENWLGLVLKREEYPLQKDIRRNL